MPYVILFIFLTLSLSCSSLRTLKKNPSAQDIFNHAEWLKKKSYYKKSLTYFNQLKSQYLYHRLSKEADLAIADVYFKQEEWKKATRLYGSFLERYPRHPKRDFVLYRLGLSYFNQLPTTEDRDLTMAKRTLFYLNKHLKSYSQSSYRKEVRTYKKKVLDLLARKQWMTANFHLKKQRPRSALPYLLELKKTYLPILPKKPSKNTSLPSRKQLNTIIKQAKKHPAMAKAN